MKNTGNIIGDLQERAKELRCLYEVEKALNDVKRPLPEVMRDVAEAIGPGWQFPEICVAAIELEGEVFESTGFRVTSCILETPVLMQGDVVGNMKVCYTEDCPEEDKGPFLEEEVQLLASLADRLGHYLLFRKLQSMGKKWRELESMSQEAGEENWQVIIDLLRETDDSLFLRVSRKMLNFLCSIGISEGQSMLKQIDNDYDPEEFGTGETNVPEVWSATDNTLLLDGGPFRLAAKYITGEEIVFYVQKWIQ
jgi:pyruvate,water dikinase